jgi:hypothetical protein
MVLVVPLLAACTFADGPTTVVVEGETYTLLALAQDDLRVSPEDLTIAGNFEVPRSLESQLAEPTAYALDGVDPRRFLLIRRVPNQPGASEPWAEYFGLLGPGTSVPAVCAYFEPGRFDGC